VSRRVTILMRARKSLAQAERGLYDAAIAFDDAADRMQIDEEKADDKLCRAAIRYTIARRRLRDAEPKR